MSIILSSVSWLTCYQGCCYTENYFNEQCKELAKNVIPKNQVNMHMNTHMTQILQYFFLDNIYNSFNDIFAINVMKITNEINLLKSIIIIYMYSLDVI